MPSADYEIRSYEFNNVVFAAIIADASAGGECILPKACRCSAAMLNPSSVVAPAPLILSGSCGLSWCRSERSAGGAAPRLLAGSHFDMASENRPHRFHHDAGDGMHSLSLRLRRGVGHRKNITAMSPITVTAFTMLTGHITVAAAPFTATTIIPVTTITLSMTTTRKTITKSMRRIIMTQNIRKHHDDD